MHSLTQGQWVRDLCASHPCGQHTWSLVCPRAELAEDLDHSSVPCRVVLSDPLLLTGIPVASTRGFPWCEALNHGGGLV
jgi:hypothetical protein